MSEYSNETLTALLKELENKIDNGFSGVHKRQDKTNGNIIENRERIEKIENWKSFIMGGMTLLSILVLPVLIFVIQQFLDHK